MTLEHSENARHLAARENWRRRALGLIEGGRLGELFVAGKPTAGSAGPLVASGPSQGGEAATRGRRLQPTTRSRRRHAAREKALSPPSSARG
jgi:hypothetical protein